MYVTIYNNNNIYLILYYIYNNNLKYLHLNQKIIFFLNSFKIYINSLT